MKALLIFSLLVSQFAFAESKECTEDVLKCEVYQELATGGKVLVNSLTTEFDGTNWDEPSIPPYECMNIMNIEGNDGLFFNVQIGESDLMTSVFPFKRDNYGLIGSDVSFTAVKGKTFSFRHDHQVLQCQLN